MLPHLPAHAAAQKAKNRSDLQIFEAPPSAEKLSLAYYGPLDAIFVQLSQLYFHTSENSGDKNLVEDFLINYRHFHILIIQLIHTPVIPILYINEKSIAA